MPFHRAEFRHIPGGDGHERAEPGIFGLCVFDLPATCRVKRLAGLVACGHINHTGKQQILSP
jgi:hypothetical protein